MSMTTYEQVQSFIKENLKRFNETGGDSAILVTRLANNQAVLDHILGSGGAEKLIRQYLSEGKTLPDDLIDELGQDPTIALAALKAGASKSKTKSKSTGERTRGPNMPKQERDAHADRIAALLTKGTCRSDAFEILLKANRPMHISEIMQEAKKTGTQLATWRESKKQSKECAFNTEG